MNRSTLFAMLAAAMTMLGVLHPAHATDLLVSSSNTNQVLRYNGTTGVFINVKGCTFADCSAAHSLDEIFDPITFRLAAGSPAIGAGAASLFHSGFERVPTGDFEGDPRPDLPDLPAIGFDERP